MTSPTEPPQYLYRYRSLDGESKTWIRDSILKSEYYFASPKAFNDPFDCRPVFRFQSSKAKIIRYFEGVFARQAPKMNRAQRRTESRQRVSDPSDDPRNEANLDRFREIYDKTVTSRIGVLCLSSRADDILMWSHYANAHRGICLQFFAQGNVIETSQPVHYRSLRPAIDPTSQTHDEMLDHAIFTKSDHWKYEKEWRLIQYKRGAGIYRIPPEALTGIILGAQISSIDKADLVAWIKSRTLPLKLYQANISEHQFAISIDEVAVK